jgi:GTPase
MSTLTDSSSLAAAVFAADPRALGRAISAVEMGGAEVASLIGAIYPRTGRARIVGVTGPPGAGKSTLVARLAGWYRRAGRRVGIIAVDPTSPFSGGAILGDRIRMSELYTDPGVFIRSMATRGTLGGLARASIDAVDILDAAGFDIVLVETVGVGQDEVDIVKVADTTVVVLLPGLGDDIQTIKAGILEIADVFVVNKADREGADRVVADLSMMLDFSSDRSFRPPIVRTVATRNQGTEELARAIAAHQSDLDSAGEANRRRAERARTRLLNLLQTRFLRTVVSDAPSREGLAAAVARLVKREEDPYTAAARLYQRYADAGRPGTERMRDA